MAQTRIRDFVTEALTDFLKERGLYLWDVQFVKEGATKVLRVLADREEGYIGTAECEEISRFLSERLDAENVLAEAYTLEVGSPGMDRTLTRPEHFVRCAGELVDVKLYAPWNGKKAFRATLDGFDGKDVHLLTEDGAPLQIEKERIAAIQLAVVF